MAGGFRRGGLGPLVLAAVLATGPVAAAAEEQVTVNLVDADLEAVVKLAAELTGRNFVVDPRVKGSINVVSGQPVPRSLVYPLLASALRMHGYALVEAGGVTKVVPEAEARMHAPPTGGREGGDRLATRLFTLRNGSAMQLVPVLKPLVGANSVINAFPGSNTLVVTDYAENLQRLATIIEALDGADSTELRLVPVRHASAVDLAQQLGRLLDGGAPGTPNDGGPRFSVQADSRSNSLLLRADSPARLQKLLALVADLDQPQGETGGIHVVPLKNAEAVALAQTLRAVVSGTALLPAATTTLPAMAAATGPGIGAQAAAPGTSVAATTALGTAAGFIQADPATNSLIITAPESIYRNLRQVVDLLDRRRAQVFIEALVVEITRDQAEEFGIQWQLGTGTGAARIAAGTNFSSGGRNIVGLAENLAKAEATGTLGVPPGLNIGFFNSNSGLAGLLRALAADNRANILSTPNLLTLDNEEARIVIGQNVPFLTGQYAQTGGAVTATPFQTIERKDVGLTLRVKPQISEGGTVRLQLQQEVSSVQDNTLAGPVTNKRAIESTVLVDDGRVVALGGLLEDGVSRGEDKVPGLGDVPGIGRLFRYETSKRAKKNLMVFLRPRIVRDAEATQAVSADRYAELLLGQRRFNTSAGFPGGPELPAGDVEGR
jgi:general secretion pathway protein D